MEVVGLSDLDKVGNGGRCCVVGVVVSIGHSQKYIKNDVHLKRCIVVLKDHSSSVDGTELSFWNDSIKEPSHLHLGDIIFLQDVKVFKSRLSYLTSQSSLSVILRTTSTAIPKHLQINPETLDALEQTTLLQNILSRYASDPLVTALRKAADASTSPSTPPNQPYHTPTNDPYKTYITSFLHPRSQLLKLPPPHLLRILDRQDTRKSSLQRLGDI